MDVYLSTVSNRLNGVMKQLTIIATIFLPLSWITGFFGQNFGFEVRHITSWQAFLILGIGLRGGRAGALARLLQAAALVLSFVRCSSASTSGAFAKGSSSRGLVVAPGEIPGYLPGALF